MSLLSCFPQETNGRTSVFDQSLRPYSNWNLTLRTCAHSLECPFGRRLTICESHPKCFLHCFYAFRDMVTFNHKNSLFCCKLNHLWSRYEEEYTFQVRKLSLKISDNFLKSKVPQISKSVPEISKE